MDRNRSVSVQTAETSNITPLPLFGREVETQQVGTQPGDQPNQRSQVIGDRLAMKLGERSENSYRRALHTLDLSRKQRKKKLDMLAAQVLLESYLNSRLPVRGSETRESDEGESSGQ